MTLTEALVTAARRYLNDNFNYWSERYAKERTGNDMPYTYTENDYNLFPRYNVLHAIMYEIERLVGKTDIAPEACNAQLISTGKTANSQFTTGGQNQVERNAMQEERDKFVDYIEHITEEELALVQPLPYCRRLETAESEAVRKSLFEQWNFQGDYWEPLEKLSPKPVIYLMKQFISGSDYEQMIAEIQRHAQPHLFKIMEDGADYEMEFSLFHPDCYETIYCDHTFEWIVYGSHENTVAFGGEWLLEFIRKLYAGREEQLNLWEQNW